MNLQIENEKRQSFRGGFAGLIHHFQLTPYPINRKVLQKSRLTILTSKKRLYAAPIASSLVLKNSIFSHRQASTVPKKKENLLLILCSYSLSIPLHNRHTFPADYLASLNNLLVVFEPSSQKKNETKEPILSCFVF
ncbi:hypothetical protein F2Q69_00052946 [Brassica cretica]|uniref:Uncharacterized protein n=1 Tax=Brassica cretica TaxID=69181 RepID=A0A8S9MWZ8_BRACR|nr:hypothetical protein F2Q69_00052946 [Brassica cretica]